jgi:aspartyl-tRNA(Asn)/glutamyl-tRNA(Gln) amidotransferase subunit A
VEAARAAGARIVELSLPLTRHAVSCYYLLATVEAASNLARFDGLRYGMRAAAHSSSLAASIASSRTQGFGAEVKRRIVLGTYALSAGHAEAWHTHAAKVRTLVCREFDEAWGACDALLGPTTPFPAIRLGERSNDPLSLYACDALTTPVSLAGLPAAALRTPLVEHEGGQLPTGAQVVTPHGADRLALRIAEVLETQLGTQALRSPAAEVQA